MPREWDPGLLVLDDVPADDWRDVVVHLNGRPLPLRLEVVGGAVRIAAHWERASSGAWRLEVLRKDGAPWSSVIRIPPAKLGDAALAAMVDDLESGLPASIAVALDRLGAFGGIDWRPPRRVTLAQELEHVRRALVGDGGRRGLIDVLNEVARDPHKVLADVHPWVRAEKARRPSPAHLPQAFAKAGNLTRDGRPMSVVDGRVESTFDVYENRLLRSFADSVDVRLRRLRRWLRLAPVVAGDVEAELAALAAALRKARWAARFLDEVGSLRRAPTDLTMVLLRKPAYRAALEGFLAFRRSAAIRATVPALDAPMSDVPTLYEAWGTLTLVEALLEAAADEDFRVVSQRLCSGVEGEPAVVLPPEVPAVRLEHVDGRVVVLTPQRRFPRGACSDLHSVSFEQIPDATLEVRWPGRRALFLFDPKYKLWGDGSGTAGDGRPKKEDIDKMHAYRDAIRDRDGGRPVRFAAILYPGPEAWFGSDVAALPALPGGDGLRKRLRELLREIISADGGCWSAHDVRGEWS
ncbi:hypothetical protein SAMN05421508_1037 [Caenispirillum bisanense]|uniref:DUF2357 domain-containing protein n=1 Tax=Caenispirillum bisanense TaxID=414052 RepID=A0A286GCN0_9PROT|nr:hypothetical protein SAMN05421508_1037 [Caenispirillum bisanense]